LEDNIVLFKGKKEGIFIILDAKVEFEQLKEVFSTKIIEAKKFFGEVKTSIIFQGRKLSDDEEQQLLDVISKQSNLNISFVEHRPFVSLKYNKDTKDERKELKKI
jgi:septum site-determining protein MinC